MKGAFLFHGRIFIRSYSYSIKRINWSTLPKDTPIELFKMDAQPTKPALLLRFTDYCKTSEFVDPLQSIR